MSCSFQHLPERCDCGKPCVVCGKERAMPRKSGGSANSEGFAFVCSLECDEARARRAWDEARRTTPPRYGR